MPQHSALLSFFVLSVTSDAVDPSQYKLVYPTLFSAGASTYNVSVDVIGPDELISCSLSFSNDGVSDFGSPLVGTLSNVWTTRRSPMSLTQSGYLYQLRLGALFIASSGNANPPVFVRADCTASSAPTSPFSTAALRLWGISPSIITSGNMTASQFSSYTAGYPWGFFSISGLDLSPCTSTTLVSITYGGVPCIPWASNFPSPIGSAVANPHCSTIIGVPATTSPIKTWSIRCVASVLAGSRLPVVVTLSDSVTNATISSSPPDLSRFAVIPNQPSISYVDVFADQVTSVSTRAQYIGSSVVAQAFDVPASPAKNSFGRVRVAFSAFGPCPRFDLRTNTTILASWNFTKTGGPECGAGTLALTSGNAQLSPFPSSGFGNASSLDAINRRGYRIVLTDSIDTLGGYESYPVDSEIGGGKLMLLKYAPPEAVSVVIDSIVSSTNGPMGVSIIINITIDQLGPLAGPFSNIPVITIGGKPCANVVRTGTRTVQAVAPVGIGTNLPLIVFLGDNTPSNTLLFSYPKPTIVSSQIVSGAEWADAFSVSLSSPTPRLSPPLVLSSTRGGAFPRGVILNVTEAGTGALMSDSGDVILLRGFGFGAWLGSGTMSSHSPDVALWKTYTNSTSQCIALAWAGRGSSAALPNCNGKWDYHGEGEMPSEGLVLWWSDSLVAFRVPPSAPGFREVVIATGGSGGTGSYGALQTSMSNWWDYSVLLRYGIDDFRITSAIHNWDAPTLGHGISNVSSTLSLSGPAFASPSSASFDPSLPLSSYSFPMSIPPTLAALASLPPLLFSMMVFQIGGVLGVDACAQSSASAGSAFAAVSSYLTQTAVPVPAKCVPTTWSTTGTSVSITYGVNSGTAVVSLPAGNGLNISVTPWLFDAIPDRAVGNAIKVVRFTPDVSLGVFPGLNGKPQYSYAAPRLTGSGLSPRSISINTWLSTVSKRLTISLDLNGGAEETAGCLTGTGMPSMSISVSFIPASAGWDTPVGGLYTMTPTTGSVLPKTKGTVPSNCSSIQGTFGFIPNLAVGRYGVRVTVSSSAGVRIGETLTNDGVAITCSSGFYGNLGRLCQSCVSGANCPGGNSSWDATDLSSPIYSPPGFFNFFGPLAASCPPNTPVAQRPAGRDVCIAACIPAAACSSANVCNSGYISVPPVATACGKCDVGFARVNPSSCSASTFPTMISLNGTCVSPSTCIAASGIVWTSTGANGENECVCSSGGSPPSSSPTPTISESPSATPSGTTSSNQSPSITPTQSPTSTPSPTPSLSIGASSSNSPSGTMTPSVTTAATTSGVVSPSSSGTAKATASYGGASTGSANCIDGQKNGVETDVDCGGGGGGGGGGAGRSCARCGLGQECSATSDCEGGGVVSNISYESVCTSSSLRCTDTRLGASFWDERISRSSSSSWPSHLVFSTTLNVTRVLFECIESGGLAALSRALGTAAANLLDTEGLGPEKVFLVASIVSMKREGGGGGGGGGGGVRRQLMGKDRHRLVGEGSSIYTRTFASSRSDSSSNRESHEVVENESTSTSSASQQMGDASRSSSSLSGALLPVRGVMDEVIDDNSISSSSQRQLVAGFSAPRKIMSSSSSSYMTPPNVTFSILIIVGPSLQAPLPWGKSNAWATDVKTAISTRRVLSAEAMVVKLKAVLLSEANITARLLDVNRTIISRSEYAWSNISLTSTRSTFTMLPVTQASFLQLDKLVSVEMAAASKSLMMGTVDTSRTIVAVCVVVIAFLVIAGLVFWRLRSEGIICGSRCKSYATCCGFWPLSDTTLHKVKSWRPRKGQRRGGSLLFGNEPPLGGGGGGGGGGLSTRGVVTGDSYDYGSVTVANPVRV